MAGYYTYFCCNFLINDYSTTSNLLKKNQKYEPPSCKADEINALLKAITDGPRFSLALPLMVDASNTVAGGVLMEDDEKI